jgi:hypothetical protein
MSKPIHVLCVALVIGIAPRLGAQASSQQSKVALPRATVARMVAVKKKPKGASYRSSAAERAASYSNLVVVIGPNGERRYARAAKPSK